VVGHFLASGFRPPFSLKGKAGYRLAEEDGVMTHRRTALSVVAGASVAASAAFAQATFPAPLPNETEACRNGYALLRDDAIEKGKLIKAASERHAEADESCKLIASYGAAEVEMIRYVETNAGRCGVSAQFAEQLKAAHKSTEAMQIRACTAAEQALRRGPRGPVGDFPDPVNGRF
jgi:hypothetical protein